MEYIGRNENQLLFSNEDFGVLVDKTTNTVSSVDRIDYFLSMTKWVGSSESPDKVHFELSKAAITDLDVNVLSNNRLYTIPSSVAAEAKRGIEWRKKNDRGGTSVGLNTARTLSKGGQIGIQKIRHIARYFPRHEVDKKAQGYRPGEDGYPSNGRIAWALWGGDAAQRWASAIVERENKKKSELSSLDLAYMGYSKPSRVDHDSFMPSNYEPDFYMRIRLDGSGVDRLYRVDTDGSCQFWDDGAWDDLGNINFDFETYDNSIDDPYDQVKKIHVTIDRESAIFIAAMIDGNPTGYIPIRQINPEETDLFEGAITEIDWEFVDQLSDDSIEDAEEYWDDDGLTAALEFAIDQDGNYTSEERSEKAKKQVRDKVGKFSKTGSTVLIGGNPEYTGKITAVNQDTQEVSVQLMNGQNVSVPASSTQEVDTYKPIGKANFKPTNLDFTGIIGEPRVPIDEPLATLPGRLPALTAPQVNLLLGDWAPWASEQRVDRKYTGDPKPPFTPKEVPDPNTALGEYYKGAFKPDGTPKNEWNPATAPNAYNDPLLRDWLDTKTKNSLGEEGFFNRGWFTPKPSNISVDPKKSKNEVSSEQNRRALDAKYNRLLSSESVVAAAKTEENAQTPENSDVDPMYMAIVAEDDPQAVMDLVSLVPASKDGTSPITYKRVPGKWERDDKILMDLRSPTPPPVIVLNNENLAEVVKQIDDDSGVAASAYIPSDVVLSNNKVMTALIAAGGLDRNRGNAAKLRRYWKFGKGALKIRWNTPGDWTRCVRQLSKYMGPRAKGYCALRHKEMTGVWPGDKKNIGKKKNRAKKAIRGSADIETLRSTDSVVSEFVHRARAESARSRVMGGRASSKPKKHGSKFIIPLVIPEEKETGDGRIFEKDSISLRDLPLPLLWQIKSGPGHDGSVVVGQIFNMERIKGGIGNAYGVFDNGEFGREAERLVRNGFLRGVSADMDKFKASDEPEDSYGESKKSGKIGEDKIRITSARVMAVTIVPKPAFQECYINLVDEKEPEKEESVISDGIYVEGMNPFDASTLTACAMVAGAIPIDPPIEWFNNPKLQGPTPLTVTDDGKVFGHIAAWHVDHIGMSFGTRPPRSRSNYSYFHTGVVRTAEGNDIPVGQLTLAGGHAGLEASAEEAVRHYDDTASAVADVHAGEDAFGIWVAGSLRSSVSPEQIRALRASAPSGDWRPINGRLELVAVCQVNVPGFPLARARVASGQVMALVAAGASVLAKMKQDPLSELNAKMDKILALQPSESDNSSLSNKVENAKNRFQEMTLSIKKEELSNKIKSVKNELDPSLNYMIQMLDDDPESELAVVPRRVRQQLAREGKAMPDGSFPIRNVSDLKNAIRAYGRAKSGSKGAVKKHIVKRARGLDRQDLIPKNWSYSPQKYQTTSIEEVSNIFREKIELVNKISKSKALFSEESLTAAVEGCPPATKDIALNLENRQKAIDNVGYGPLNPAEPNEEFWQDKADRWKIEIKNAKTAVCGNCIFFVRTPKMLDCIESGIGLGDEEAQGSIEAGNLGYCNALDFKCASQRTCNAWAAGGPVIAASDSIAGKSISPEEIKAIKAESARQKNKKDEDSPKYTPKTQPRDVQGKYRKVLARLKSDLGTAGLGRVVEKVEKAENLTFAGDYKQSAEAAKDLIGIIDRLDTKALNPDSLENVRNSAKELGRVIANLPFAFGQQAEKIRFSDVPPVLKKLIKDMIIRVEAKIGQEDADVVTSDLKNFMSGGRYFSQSDISSQMSTLLRLLT